MYVEPPRPLGAHGRALWDSIQAEYHIADAAGVELLTQACTVLDRAEELALEIVKSGFVVNGRANSLVREELQARSFVVRTLQRLGLEDLTAKPVGRPPGPQWKGHNRVA
jgi:hypothetical protein